MDATILVIGATGRTGTEVVRLLLERTLPVRAATRRPEAATSRWGRVVETVLFDFDRPETFGPALRGIEKVFLIARPADSHSDQAGIPFVDEARKQDVRHVVNLTAMGVELDEAFSLRILERYIEASGIPFTHLRPNWFMQNFDSGPMFADIRTTGALHLPAGDGKVSFIDVRDVAAVAFAALTDPAHECRAYTLTGGESLDHTQAMAALSHACGRAIPYIPLTEEAACARLVEAGVPSDRIERWREFYRKVRAGLCAPVSPDVETILGRPPITMHQYARNHATAWR